jgi:hypothetical protein
MSTSSRSPSDSCDADPVLESAVHLLSTHKVDLACGLTLCGELVDDLEPVSFLPAECDPRYCLDCVQAAIRWSAAPVGVHSGDDCL